jgi:hypothetical protein
VVEGKPRRFYKDGFGRSLDRGYEANTKTARAQADPGFQRDDGEP